MNNTHDDEYPDRYKNREKQLADVCNSDALAIAKELDAGIQSKVDIRPCLNAVIADPRYDAHTSAMKKAISVQDRDAWQKAYTKFYHEVLGPEQTKFWQSINEKLSPDGLCHLELVPSKENPDIADHVLISCEDKRPMS